MYSWAIVLPILRSLVLALAAVATVAAPCAPALAFEAPCAMAGCDEDARGQVRSSGCCCASSQTAAGTEASPTTSAGAKSVPQASAAPAADGPQPAFGALGAGERSPEPVPLFLLNTSLLL